MVEETFRSMRREGPWSYMSSQFISKDAIMATRARVTDACLSRPSWRTMFEAFRTEHEASLHYMYRPFSAPLLGYGARGIEGLARVDLQDAEAPVRCFLAQLTRFRLLRVYTAVSLYRRKTGKLPTAWRDLVPAYLPEPLTDPFSDKELLLKRGDSGLCIYSVGEDGEDDGAAGCFSIDEADRNEIDRGEDIVVVVPLVIEPSR